MGAQLHIIASRFGAFLRVDDWWDYKILPLLAVYAATALVLRVPLTAVWLGGLELLAALSVLAAFAALINDLSDFQDDRAAGKPNLLSQHSKGLALVALAGAGAGGVAFGWLWRDDLPLVTLYVGAWAAFLVYSVPPVRLKTRAGWGVVAIGLGEAALPSLVAAQLCGRAAASPISPVWMAAVAVWSFAHGSRAILWHQLRDEPADARACVATFVRRRGAELAKRIATRLLFPAEIASLTCMLAMIGSILSWLGMALYLCILSLRMRLRSTVPVVVDPVRHHELLLQDYYIYYFPLALVAAAAAHHEADAVAFLVWLALFPRPLLRLMRGPFRLLRQARSVG